MPDHHNPGPTGTDRRDPQRPAHSQPPLTPDRAEQRHEPDRSGLQHEDPDIRGNVDRGSDDDVPSIVPRTDDDLADEPGIGP